MVEQLPYFFILQLPNLMSDEPTWAEWSQWSPCGASCGPPSKRVRRRKCQGAIESACKGDPVQWRACKTSPCPQEKTSQSSAASEVKTTTKVTVPADVRKWEREKMERIEAEYQRIGATYAKKPEAAEQRTHRLLLRLLPSIHLFQIIAICDIDMIILCCVYIICKLYCGAWWLISSFVAFRSKGLMFESHSSRHSGPLGKSFTRSCLWRFGVKLRHSIRAVSGAPLTSNGFEEAL